jgi:hypothetical protein
MRATTWLLAVVMVLFLLPSPGLYACPGGTPPAPEAAQPDKPVKKKKKSTRKKSGSDKKKKKKKKKKKNRKKKPEKKKAEKKKEAPVWTPADTVFGSFLWMARQMPDFQDFPKGTEEVSLSVVAKKGKGLVFVEGCTATMEKKRWVVSGCRVVHIRQKGFLTKLVETGADTSSSPESASQLRDSFKKIKKSPGPDKLKSFILPSTLSNRKGHTALDDITMDRKACGKKAHKRAIRNLPLPRYIGPDVLVFDLTYTAGTSSRAHKVRLNGAKTRKGWKLGSLRVHCH